MRICCLLSMEVALIFPHQLFEKNPCLTDAVECAYLVEDELFFTQYNFHRKKLILHRASMKFYQQYLESTGLKVEYVDSAEGIHMEALFQRVHQAGVSAVHIVDPADYLLTRRVRRFSRQYGIELKVHESPMFLNSLDELIARLRKTKTGYLMAGFYKEQRKAMDLLMNGDEPKGGKWSYDEENRKKLPKDVVLPDLYKPAQNGLLREAIGYVNAHFTSNHGITDDFFYPVTFHEAEKCLEDFLERRMDLFGDYEDAIARKESFLFHSVLTPALNTGLVTPDHVIRKTLEYHSQRNYPLNSLEGFIRQIIGWREFMRGIYEFEGVYQRTNNHFHHRRPLPGSFWKGSTGIEPVDDVIKKVLKNGYCHHIERLMILGNFMLLCEFDPGDVYRWFMELFIDAYDWVMVPNVYGMTQYADGGLLSTKPYISGSNYILKMSDYKKGEWCRIWDALYWRFIHVHREEFSKNQRMSMMIRLLEKMDKSRLKSHLEVAESFLSSFH